MIKRLTYPEIDFVKYAECLADALQSNVFAQKEVLDFLCESWELLVYDDYKYVMPLPLKSRLGQKFITCPIFCQQLGIFGPDDNPEINEEFFDYTLQNYKTYLYSFNTGNTLRKNLTFRKNYFIPIGLYERQRRKYSKGRKSAVKSAGHLKFKQVEQNSETLNFVRKFHKGLAKQSDLETMISFMNFLEKKNMLRLYGAYLEGQLLTVSALIDDGTSVYLLALVTDEKFRNENPTSFLVDKILEKYIGSRNFSFMGSNVRSIGIFNSSFGADLQEYPVIQFSKKELALNCIKSLVR
ncbi:GNAT family N-acetyltransferase [Chryseobacterium sp.]|uniref:GNAT family N-acetyltransferase n=1 Tax=Chryseobacterium sp. TaxID=1871047 RepID=UPI0012AA727D|nr:GNAT family N-acetyltransferase [Chryseobacterium sp.]QFG53244.1 GNAT family N-acetyltransferase [Chryseobacterium sp.]